MKLYPRSLLSKMPGNGIVQTGGKTSSGIAAMVDAHWIGRGRTFGGIVDAQMLQFPEAGGKADTDLP